MAADQLPQRDQVIVGFNPDLRSDNTDGAGQLSVGIKDGRPDADGVVDVFSMGNGVAVPPYLFQLRL